MFCFRCFSMPGSPRTRLRIRSPSTMSPTRCCESSATGLREFLPESRSHSTSSSPSGRSARRLEKPRELGDGRRAHRAAGFGVGAEGGSACHAGRFPRRPDPGRTSRRSLSHPGSTPKILYVQQFWSSSIRSAASRRLSRRSGARGDIGAELDVAPAGAITEEEWRACWPTVDGAEPEFEPVSADDRPPRRQRLNPGDVRHAGAASRPG